MTRRPPRSPLFPHTTLSRSPRERQRLRLDPPRLGACPNSPRGRRSPAWIADDAPTGAGQDLVGGGLDRKSTRLNSSHANISYAGFCLQKKKNKKTDDTKQN